MRCPVRTDRPSHGRFLLEFAGSLRRLLTWDRCVRRAPQSECRCDKMQDKSPLQCNHRRPPLGPLWLKELAPEMEVSLFSWTDFVRRFAASCFAFSSSTFFLARISSRFWEP